MEPPVQNPPVDRQFMRLVVGWKGKPKQKAEAGKGSIKAQRGERNQSGGDFLVELTTFHLRRRISW